ncbi:MAG: winged helix-turn-helix transcriptional regulator [Solirubrobacterales bacterium]|nr:winged helix-turn-helix transcriptional regulator [Solirubrobacterales bacterium]MBV9809498.1 winged helix-turn-helix transcriptional regulator [Solirubrobacterales bacterium]
MAVDTSPGTVVMLMRLATAIKKRSTEDLMGIKLRQLMLLSYLRRGIPAMQQQLCEALWLDPNNCVLLLNELEDMGYVERRRDAADRRRHVVVLTDEGLAALERAEQAQESLGEEMFAALSDEERSTLRSLLGRVLEPAASR